MRRPSSLRRNAASACLWLVMSRATTEEPATLPALFLACEIMRDTPIYLDAPAGPEGTKLGVNCRPSSLASSVLETAPGTRVAFGENGFSRNFRAGHGA